ncbi:hypothetical protein VTH82DRAFT_5521 [Thermothelomyces myriococcoides]
MPGLAASRHAPRPRRSGLANANLTATPAPIGSENPGNNGAENAIDPIIHRSSTPSSSWSASPSSTSITTANAAAPFPTRAVRNENEHPRPNRPAGSASASAAAHELARYAKIVRRLQWKLPFLAQGYRQAVNRVGADRAAVAEAELMFKLDFFEYYMLIERALVHLLGVFGVTVDRGTSVSEGQPAAAGTSAGHDPGEDNKNSSNYHHNNNNYHYYYNYYSKDGRNDTTDRGDKEDNGGGGGGGDHARGSAARGLAASRWRDRPARHRYHANVLAALDRPDSPLHGPLGTGEVRAQLGRAKELRNRWKTAGDDDDDDYAEKEHDDDDDDDGRKGGNGTSWAESGGAVGPELGGRRSRKVAAAPLDSYRLEHMLEVIFRGFDEAFRIAEEYVRRGGTTGAEGDVDMDWTAIGDEEEQWEFMVDAMDWEAV